MTRTVELDIRDLVCPETVAVVRRALVAIEPDEQLVVTGDDPSAVRSIRRSCDRHGYNVQATEDSSDGDFTLLITVTEEAVDARE